METWQERAIKRHEERRTMIPEPVPVRHPGKKRKKPLKVHAIVLVRSPELRDELERKRKKWGWPEREVALEKVYRTSYATESARDNAMQVILKDWLGRRWEEVRPCSRLVRNGRLAACDAGW